MGFECISEGELVGCEGKIRVRYDWKVFGLSNWYNGVFIYWGEEGYVGVSLGGRVVVR